MSRSKIITYILIAYFWSYALWIGGIVLAQQIGITIPLNEVLLNKVLKGDLITELIPSIILVSLAVYGPMIGVFLLTLFHKDMRAMVKARASLHFNKKYLLQIITIVIIIFVIPIISGSLVIPDLKIRENTTLFNALLLFGSMIIFQFLTSGLEEIGWRGFLLPEMLKKKNIWDASVITGLIWGLWHTPIVLYIFISQGLSSPSTLIGSFIGFIVSIVGMSIFHTYYYIKTRNFLFSIIIHVVYNAVPQFLALIYTNTYSVGIITQLLFFGIIIFLTSRQKKYFDQDNTTLKIQ